MTTKFTYNHIKEHLVSLGEKDENIRTILIVGSQARESNPADEWSDLDVVMFARNPDEFLFHKEWLNEIGKPYITFLEETAVGGGKERRVMFQGGLDVDFSVFLVSSFQGLMKTHDVQDVLSKGYSTLLDKDGMASDLVVDKDVSSANFSPTSYEINNDIHDFWYHAIWVAKKLRRGEVLVAKSCCDEYMINLLLKMIRHKTKLEKGDTYNTWYGYRYFEKWAEPEVVGRFISLLPRYDSDEIWKSLEGMMKFYRELATHVCKILNYEYPYEADHYASKYITEINNTGK